MAGNSVETKLPYAHSLDDLVKRNPKNVEYLESYRIDRAIQDTREEFPDFSFATDMAGETTSSFFRNLINENSFWGRGREDLPIRSASLMVLESHDALKDCSEDDKRSFLDLAAEFSIALHSKAFGKLRRSRYYGFADGSFLKAERMQQERRIADLQKLQKDLGEKASFAPPGQRR